MIQLSILIAAALSIGAPVPAAAQSSPVVLLVNPKLDLKSVAEFAAWAKETNKSSNKPLSYSSSGPASQRLGETLARKLGIRIVHVPYRPASQGVLDLIGGHIDFSVVDIGAAEGLIQVGLVTALAVASRQRLPDFPDLPTFAEAGYPEFAKVSRAASRTTMTRQLVPSTIER